MGSDREYIGKSFGETERGFEEKVGGKVVIRGESTTMIYEIFFV